jgi:2-dehydro-3-deoxy-D-gluconate 5-dehydrogenase
MKLFDLNGKVAVVTGGNSGIGLGMARGLCDAGATVVIVARNEVKSAEAVKELEAAGGKALAVTCDVTNQESIETMVRVVLERCGGIDILVNNAGTTVRKRPEDLSFQEWQSVIATNLDSAFLCSTACYETMKQRGGGKILNNGSMLSLFGSPWGSAYAASKGGLVQLTKSLATAWAQDNIQVNCFLPGWIDTPLTVAAREQVSGLNEKVLARTPAKRWGNIDDFRGIAIFLASSASDFITGTAIAVDGGFSVNVL